MIRTSLLLLLLLPSLSLFPQEKRLYRSNSLGMRLEALDDRDEAPFLLEVTRWPDRIVEELRDESGILSTKTLVYSGARLTEEVVEEAGVITVRRLYDQQGRLIDELESQRRRVFSYREGKLAAITVSDADEQILWTEDYSYTSDGRLREVNRTLPDGSVAITVFNFAGGRLVEELSQESGRVSASRFDRAGRLSGQETRGPDGALLSYTEYEYGADGGLLLATTRHDLVGQTVLTRNYDGQGWLVSERLSGAAAYVISYQRDQEGREILTRKTGDQGVEEWRYTYDSEGDLIEESYRLKGIIQRVRTYTGEREWHDDLHRNGTPVLRVFFQADQKVGEEPL